MKLAMTFNFTDGERERITRYQREEMGAKGLPKLATRAMLRDWIGEAVDSHWIDVEDVESSVYERKRDATEG